MNGFNIGEIIVSTRTSYGLTNGKSYTVTEDEYWGMGENDGSVVTVICDLGIVWLYDCLVFVTLQEYRDKQLKELLYGV